MRETIAGETEQLQKHEDANTSMQLGCYLIQYRYWLTKYFDKHI